MNRTSARVMSLFGVPVVLAAVTAGLVISAGSAGAQSPTAETARCDGTRTGTAFGIGSFRDLQPFTAGVGGSPDSVDVHIARKDDETAPLTVRVRSFDDATGQPGEVFASATVPATSFAPYADRQISPISTVSFASGTALAAGDRYALELSSDGSYVTDTVNGSNCGVARFAYPGGAFQPAEAGYSIPVVARVRPATPPPASAVSVRGGGTLTSGDGQRYSIAVDARATTTGQVSGKYSLSGGGPDTTAGSRTITSVTRTSTGSTVTGTATTTNGRTVTFTLTVVDKPGGKDQVTVKLGSTTVSGTLSNGDITTTG